MNRDIQQKVIILKSPTQTGLETALNNAADEGWRLHDIASMVLLEGGGVYVGERGYYFEPNILILEKSEEKRIYRCKKLRRGVNSEEDTNKLNELIQEQDADGFRLAKLIPLIMIGAYPDRPLKGTSAFLMVFESVQAPETVV